MRLVGIALGKFSQMAEQNARTNEENGRDMIIITEEKSSLVKDEEVTSKAPGRAPRKLSTIPEYEPGRAKADEGPPGSSYSLCSVDEYSSTSSTDSLPLSHQPDDGDDCAGIVLNCLFCRFYDLFLMLPDTCERAANRACPSYQQFASSAGPVHSNDCNCSCQFDCGLFDACQETGECLELAMEISEVCYR